MERKRRILKEIEQHIQPLLLAKIEKEQEVLFEVHKEHLLPACQYIHGERKARLFTMVGNDERQINGNFILYYVFAIDEDDGAGR